MQQRTNEGDECVCDQCQQPFADGARIMVGNHVICAPCTMLPPEQKVVPLKFDGGKNRLELLPPEFVEGIGMVLSFGAIKYAPGNWSVGDGFEWSRLYGAMLRHMFAWARGEDDDPESGFSHLDHAGCMLAFLRAHVARGKGTDDRKQIGTAA